MIPFNLNFDRVTGFSCLYMVAVLISVYKMYQVGWGGGGTKGLGGPGEIA